jgi:tetratricopeptide (TPR) repeat protein
MANDAPDDTLELASEFLLQAGIFTHQGQFREAAMELAKAIELMPTNHSLFLRRGELLGRTGQWKEAVASLKRGVESDPTNAWAYFLLAPILLSNGEVEEYRQLCEQIAVRCNGTNDAGQADNMAKACLIHPGCGVDLRTVAAWAEAAVALGRQSEYLPWFKLCKALAKYRQGDFSGSADWAQQTLASAGAILERDAAAYLVLAMAQMKLRQGAAALIALGKGVEIVEKKLPKLDSGDLGGQWVDVVIANLLLREAKALIERDSLKPWGN